MEIPPPTRISPVAPATAVPAGPDHGPQNREIIQAVHALNRTQMFGQDNELEFHRDQASRRMVIRVVNRKTQEVVSQIPPEYVLRLAEGLK